MYKILHVPSSTYLKMHKSELASLITVLDQDTISDRFLNLIWSELELINSKRTDSFNYVYLKLPTKELAILYLDTFIEGIQNSNFFDSAAISLYDEINFYEIIEEE